MNKDLKIIKQVDLTFSLDNFEGPLDLLLHLAKTNELEIADINLNTIIDQYLHFIEQAKDYSIEISSAYIEMAAELIRLKTQSILPNKYSDEEFLDELEELSLDREELIEKLLEYKRYKEVSSDFDELQEKRQNYFSKKPDNLKEYRDNTYKNSLSIEDFINATKKYLQKIEDKKSETQTLSLDEITIEENLDFLMQLETSFSLVEKFQTLHRKNSLNLFLAVLEALKNQYITFEQISEDIIIYPCKEFDE